MTLVTVDLRRPDADGEWTRITPWPCPMDGVHWAQVSLRISAAIGAPGARYRPGPDDWTVTH